MAESVRVRPRVARGPRVSAEATRGSSAISAPNCTTGTTRPRIPKATSPSPVNTKAAPRPVRPRRAANALAGDTPQLQAARGTRLSTARDGIGARHPGCRRGRCQEHSVAQDGGCQQEDVVGQDEGPALQGRPGPGCPDQVECRARAGPEAQLRGGPGRGGHRHREPAHGLRHVHRVDCGHQGRELLMGGRGRQCRQRILTCVLEEHPPLVGLARVAQRDARHEPVALGLGQRVGALHVDRVLGGDTMKGAAAGSVRAVDGDLRSSIASSSADWVLGEARLISSASTMLAKIGPGPELERARVSLVEDAHAGHVAGQQVGRELDAPDRAVDAAGQRLGQHGLAHARARPRSAGGPRRAARSRDSRTASGLPAMHATPRRRESAAAVSAPCRPACRSSVLRRGVAVRDQASPMGAAHATPQCQRPGARPRPRVGRAPG